MVIIKSQQVTPCKIHCLTLAYLEKAYRIFKSVNFCNLVAYSRNEILDKTGNKLIIDKKNKKTIAID